MIFKIFRKTIEKVGWKITGNWNEISGNSKKRKKSRNKSEFNKSELFDSFPSIFQLIRSIIHVVSYKNQVRCTRSRWKASKLPRIQHSSAYPHCIECTCATQRYCMLIKFHKPYSMHKQLRHKSRARAKKKKNQRRVQCASAGSVHTTSREMDTTAVSIWFIRYSCYMYAAAYFERVHVGGRGDGRTDRTGLTENSHACKKCVVRFHFPTASQRIKRKTVGKCREMYGRCGSGTWRNSKGIELTPEYSSIQLPNQPQRRPMNRSSLSLSRQCPPFFLVAQTSRRANWNRIVLVPLQ